MVDCRPSIARTWVLVLARAFCTSGSTRLGAGAGLATGGGGAMVGVDPPIHISIPLRIHLHDL